MQAIERRTQPAQHIRIGIGGIDLAARKHVSPAQHVRKSVAFDHEYFHAIGRIAQEHHSRGLAWRRRYRLIIEYQFCSHTFQRDEEIARTRRSLLFDAGVLCSLHVFCNFTGQHFRIFLWRDRYCIQRHIGELLIHVVGGDGPGNLLAEPFERWPPAYPPAPEYRSTR